MHRAGGARECVSDARRGLRTGIHAIHVRTQLRQSVEQSDFVRPVERVGRHEIHDGDGAAYDELTSLHVLVEHDGHFAEVLTRERHLSRAGW